MKTFEVICPVFNEQNTVPLFFQRILTVFASLKERYACRLVFVDNASTDATQELVRGLAAQHSWVELIVLSRNFGYQCSVECGLRNSEADVTGVIDVDCEDPPELFGQFLAWLEQGHDIVYGERADREEAWIIKALRKIYYRLTRAAADENFILDMAEFCVMSDAVRRAVTSDSNSYPFIRASIGRVGFDVKNVPYKRQKRIAGKSHYNILRMWLFGVGGILSSSTLWLRSAVYLFPVWLTASAALLINSALSGHPFYFQLFVAGSFALLLYIAAGISIYLARVYKNGLNRPNYYINLRKCATKGRRLV
jgi:polyisoprenyl-phosphate glycosyltransferase